MTMTAENKPVRIEYNRRTRRKARSLMFWLNAKEQDVLDLFATLPNAIQVGAGDRQYVYVEGTRDDRVLLVAHADTVFENRNQKVMPKYSAGKYFSSVQNIGIGADDRTGCCIAWRLRDLGHSILICNKEEIGCVGSRFLMEDNAMADKLNNTHRFAIQFDRHGSSDLVYYNVGSDPFNNWCEANFKGYKKAQGSSTDIRHLCRKMCGVNISVGYYNEHWATEYQLEKEFIRTLETTREVISQKDLPRFEIPPAPKYDYKSIYNGYGGEDYEDFYGRGHRDWEGPSHHGHINQSARTYNVVNNTRPSHVDRLGDGRYNLDTIMVCRWCKGMLDFSEAEEHRFMCPFPDCGKKL